MRRIVVRRTQQDIASARSFLASRCARARIAQNETTMIPFEKRTKRMIVSLYPVSIHIMTMSVTTGSIASSKNKLQSAHGMLFDDHIILFDSNTVFDFEL